MIRTMANFTHKRGISRDAREWDVRIRMTSFEFIRISSQPIKKIACFINILSTKVSIL